MLSNNVFLNISSQLELTNKGKQSAKSMIMILKVVGKRQLLEGTQNKNT